MATADERMKILKMIQEGKISAEEGAQLIQALETAGSPGSAGPAGGPARPDAPLPPQGPKGPGRYFRVRITDMASGRSKVNVRLPLGLINAGMKMGARFAPEIEGMDMTQLTQYLNSGEVGQIVDVYDDEDGEHVEVYIE
jgi:hypothetical protein